MTTSPLTWRPLRRIDREKLILGFAAPALALATAFVIISLVMSLTGQNPFLAFQIMGDYGTKADSQVWIINKAIPYYLSAVAVAIGFRMNLFNIGVDGQYQVAAFFAAAVGGYLTFSGTLRIPFILLTAMAVGAIWAGIAGFLKATRGVSEVISTIMLNAIGGALIGYLLHDGRLAERTQNIVHTPYLPESTMFFTIDTDAGRIYGTIVIAIVAGLAYWYLLGRTRFGFDLRSVGESESAARAGGVSVKRMVVTAMVLSGAMAGLVGMPTLLNDSGTFGNNFPGGIGFMGIAIALLGRNHAVGMAFAALLWAFLERTGGRLNFEGYNQEIVGVMQGIIVLSVVIAYELVRRWGLRRQQRMVGAQLAARAAATPATAGAAVSMEKSPATPGPTGDRRAGKNGSDDPTDPEVS
ncbi:ABC transporter permease [Streptomyces calidiresistens]|uniref:ABC transporter permease n=1 Tax=Streptomyces calidiresistens TaxID=1485586 RepID=A0A7W3XWA1_9ACTN|nr:ABC transporter permease [Streptomyces calidiresistens]MBB0229507.1 ABC transporter permease [Streptomyces calidiresistens]